MVQNIHVLGSKILAVAKFWAQNQKFDISSQLKLILSCDVKDLIGTTLTTFMEGKPDKTHLHGTETVLVVANRSEDLQMQIVDLLVF